MRQPQIPETPYNRHIPAVDDGESRAEHAYVQARDLWSRRPSLFEFHFYTLPLALIIGGTAIGMADEALGLHIARDMAQVQVEPHSNIVDRSIERVIHDMGVQAQQAEKN